MQTSLRSHLLRQLLLPLTAVFLLSCVLSYGAALHFAAEEYNRTLYDMVQSLAHQVRQTDSGPVLDLPPAAEKIFLWDDVDTTYYRVWGEASGQIAGYAELVSPKGSAEDFHGVRISQAVVRGESIRLATLIVHPAADGEAVYVQVGETQRKRRRLAQTVLVAVLFPQLVLIGLVAYVVNRGVRRGLEPLKTISARLDAGGPAALEPIPEKGVPREVLTLTRALHLLLQKLQASLKAQQRFVADAAHQLRTPLTAIRLNLERAFAEQDAGDVRQALEQVRISTERAVRLSAQLLALARVEDGVAEVAFEKIDLRELVREAGSEWAGVAALRKVDLSLDAPASPVWISGNPHMLREMISNLIDNAIKHGSPSGGSVRIAVDAAVRPSITIADEGPGIAPALREKVVQRFSRGDSGGDGAGLGLAISVETARLHGGTLKLLDPAEGHGLIVLIEFPALEGEA